MFKSVKPGLHLMQFYTAEGVLNGWTFEKSLTALSLMGFATLHDISATIANGHSGARGAH
jgi:hypothetical protein